MTRLSVERLRVERVNGECDTITALDTRLSQSQTNTKRPPTSQIKGKYLSAKLSL